MLTMTITIRWAECQWNIASEPAAGHQLGIALSHSLLSLFFCFSFLPRFPSLSLSQRQTPCSRRSILPQYHSMCKGCPLPLPQPTTNALWKINRQDEASAYPAVGKAGGGGTVQYRPSICWPFTVSTHRAHDVVATLNQRQRRWFNVATTSCARWVLCADSHQTCREQSPWSRDSHLLAQDWLFNAS